MERKCHFCSRTSSIHFLENEGAWVCSKCWEIIAEIVNRFIHAQGIVTELRENESDIAR